MLDILKVNTVQKKNVAGRDGMNGKLSLRTDRSKKQSLTACLTTACLTVGWGGEGSQA